MQHLNLGLYLPRRLNQFLGKTSDGKGILKINDLELEVSFNSLSHDCFLDKETYPNIEYLHMICDVPINVCEITCNADFTFDFKGSDVTCLFHSFWNQVKVQGADDIQWEVRNTEHNKGILCKYIQTASTKYV